MNIYEKPLHEILEYVAKRALMLLSKLLGFKACCLYLATVLLIRGTIAQDIWLYVMVTVLCSTSGLRIADACMSGRMYSRKGDVYEENVSQEYTMAQSPRSIHHTDSGAALSSGRKRIRALLDTGGGK